MIRNNFMVSDRIPDLVGQTALVSQGAPQMETNTPPPPAQRTPTWTVMRQDDHGNHFVVATKLAQQAAEQLVALYEQRGHKQHYWATSENGD
jgi:hypothetical protein